LNNEELKELDASFQQIDDDLSEFL